jgi:hypothetical protein
VSFCRQRPKRHRLLSPLEQVRKADGISLAAFINFCNLDFSDQDLVFVERFVFNILLFTLIFKNLALIKSIYKVLFEIFLSFYQLSKA